jgi:peroxidase
MKRFLLSAAIVAALPMATAPQSNKPSNVSPALLNQFRPIGGSGNNLQHPQFDAIPGAPELAIAPLNFAPGTNDGLVSGPNPRVISNEISGGTGLNGVNAETDDPNASAWLYVFGQFLDHDIDLEETPTTSPAINIVVPPGDPVFTPGTTIAMTRALRSGTTNTIINGTAGYLDLSQLYGSTTDDAASLRNADGTLQSSGDGQYLPVVDDAFITGDPRVMENPELSAATILFMREHNYWVQQLAGSHPNWTGDQLYQMARAITTAEYQNIVYNEYLPVLIGGVLGPYHGYDPNVNAQVTQEFSTAGFRMGHSEISDTQEGLDNAGNTTFTESLAQAFFNTATIDETNGINALLRGVTADFSQATDVYVVAALRDLLFAPLPGGDIDEMDLIAIDIQRERDVGVGTLNETRQALGMQPYRSFGEVTSDPILQANLQKVYGDVENLDLFIGGLAEDHAAGAKVGPTFQAVIARQFDALRSGDRFFWLNQGFDNATAAMIGNTTLSQIITRNTDSTNVRRNVFVISSPVPSNHVPIPPNINTHGRHPIFE